MTSASALPHDVPVDPPVERAVLGGVLIQSSTLALLDSLRIDAFLAERNRLILAVMRALAARGDAIDVLTVAAELEGQGQLEAAGGRAYLAICLEEASVASITPTHVALIQEASIKRRLAELLHRGREAALNGQPVGAIMEDVARELTELRRPGGQAAPDWPLYDAADSWDFPGITELIEFVLPATGIVWWGGLPKRYKSLFALYIALAIACRRSHVAKQFLVKAFPKILYVAREDGGPRLQDRRDDILSAWTQRPEPGAIVFVIRPRLDLGNPEHVGWLRERCLRLGISMLVLDTWTALSPSADPLGTKDQTTLATVVVRLCEDIGGLVVVVDHSRKNRPEGQPLSSADIFGPPQKWQAAEHIVMLDVVEAGRRLEVFIEGKDMETRRFFLAVSPRGSGEEKFAYAGSVEDLADAQRAVGTKNRDAVEAVVCAAGVALSTGEIVDVLKVDGVTLSKDTVLKHVQALVKAGRAQ